MPSSNFERHRRILGNLYNKIILSNMSNIESGGSLPQSNASKTKAATNSLHAAGPPSAGSNSWISASYGSFELLMVVLDVDAAVA
jgi:hypothetical protein